MDSQLRSVLVTDGQEDVLAPYHQEPIISGGDGQSDYAGRVILELWISREVGALRGVEQDGRGLALFVEPATEDVEAEELLQRVVAALPKRVHF